MDCKKCQALCESRTQIVSADPVPQGLLIVGEAPGADEDREGIGFVGRAGKTLHNLLRHQGLERGRDYGCANIARCRPPENRKPSSSEVWDCIPYLAETIRASRPTAILCVGASAASVFFGSTPLAQIIAELRHLPQESLLDIHPQLQPIRELLEEVPIIPMPHTSPLAWNRKAPDGREWSLIGRQQIRIAADFTKRGHAA